MLQMNYQNLIQLKTFEERFNYLKQRGNVGMETFGSERYLNQKFYTSPEWRRVRDQVIIRDNGCDLGCPDRPIFGRPIVHHINPITPNDLRHGLGILLDENNLICISHDTHNLLHYGDLNDTDIWKERTPGDTKLW